MRSRLDDVRWGAKWGVFVGLLYTALAAAVVAAKGGIPDSLAARFSLSELLATYAASALLGGIILGLLRPFTARRVGAALVGVVVVLPASFAFALLYAGPISRWGGAALFSVVGSAMFLGGYGGYKLWELRSFDPYTYLNPPTVAPRRDKRR